MLCKWPKTPNASKKRTCNGIKGQPGASSRSNGRSGFRLEGPPSTILHSGRNTLFEYNGLVIKAFAKPGFFKALWYGLFGKSKARRSYEYAQRLLALGIATPEPVAYQEVRVMGFLRESYYVSRKSLCPHTFRDLIGPISPISPISPICRILLI